LSVSVGDTVRIVSQDGRSETMGMVTALSKSAFSIAPFGFIEGFKIGDRVYIVDEGMRIPVGEALLGRVVDPFMRPLDDLGPIVASQSYPIIKPPIPPLRRGLINEIFVTGVKSIDGLLTCGKGQKVGIFAGSGVGKSTLMGMIVRGSQAQVKVVALIGERGREVPEFIQHNLGGDLSNTVIIVATSDDSALMRKYGAFSAMSVAEYFKDQGRDVLFLMDSVTRFAMAQRDIGLALGEPPTTKGYPPSVLTLMPQLMERAGKEVGKGAITAFFTVLVEGDDLSDPIADQARSILDGHIVLSREMTDYGIYPPVSILNSASRLMGSIVSADQLQVAQKFRRMYHLLKENEVLVRIGAYQKGSDTELDEALGKKREMENFLRQPATETSSFEATKEALLKIGR
ncbi:MAG: flagellar protein export ATPase FliI, partial [Campylobacterales bacterium]